MARAARKDPEQRPLSDFRAEDFELWLRRPTRFRHAFAESTLSRYLRTAGYFLDFCAREGILCADEVNVAWLRKWLIGPDPAKPAYSASTRTVMLSALHLLYLHWQEAGYALDNPVEKYLAEAKATQKRGGRAPKPLPTVLSWDEQDALLAAALDNPRSATGARDYAMIALLVVTGLRCEEACALTVKQLDIAAATLRVTGKGAKERVVRWSYDAELLRTAIAHWQQYRSSDSPYVLHTRTGAPMTHTLVYQQLGAYLNKAGIESRRRGPHLLRHTSISRQLARGVPLLQVQDNAGHESLATLQRYAHLLV